jgi:hypothetical protein
MCLPIRGSHFVSSKIPDPLVGVGEAVKLLGLAENTIRNMCNRGEIDHVRDPANDRFKFKFSTLMRVLQEREKENTRKARERRAAMDARQKAERKSKS